ncbi:hypothetical protein Tsubulata_035931 [Turnera subulata]|uniref:CCHC-type domain-containing protein n=1 Tax=Turnera subulata TaxID=218843 RepID=A0A9Q0F125_9ROSI|nr:hypothetical protein Tsubulata_035931 [Turnera subulata]
MLHKRWENTLIVKMWGRNIGYRTLCSRLPNLWKLKESVRVVDLENNFYFVCFLNCSDYLRALTDGLWPVLGHYLTMEPWKPQFNPNTDKVTTIVAWIQIPGLSSEYYDRGILRAVCNMIGKLVRIDHDTQEAIRERYARVAVELDLSKPLQSQVFVDGRWYFISYEHILQICFDCGLAGHLMLICPSRHQTQGNSGENQMDVTTADEQATEGPNEPAHHVFQAPPPSAHPPRGEWMIAGRRRRTSRSTGGQSQKETSTEKESFNTNQSGFRFDVLDDYVTVDHPSVQVKGKAMINAINVENHAPSLQIPIEVATPAKPFIPEIPNNDSINA